MKRITYNFDYKIKANENGEEQLIIDGYANRSYKEGQKIVDRGNEHIPPEEWDVKEWLLNPIILFNHNKDNPVGKGLDVNVTKDGLWTKALISNSDVPEIKKVRDLIKEKILNSFSVGIDVREEEESEKGIINLKGVKLLEISIVSLPMNQASQFQVSTKQLKTKSLNEIRETITKEKGAILASEIHRQIGELQKNDENFNRDDILMKIANEAKISMDELFEFLAGNIVSASDNLINALGNNLNLEISRLNDFNSVDEAINAKKIERPDNQENQDDINNPDNQENEEDELLMEEEEEEENKKELMEDETPLEEEEKQVDPTTVQTVIISKNRFENKEDAIKWINENNYSSESIDETEESYRFRQRNPEDFIEDSFRTMEITDGISIIIGHLKNEFKQELQGEDFNDCVSKHIKLGLQHGKTQDQAIAYALNVCREENKSCELNIKDWNKIFDEIDHFKKNYLPPLQVPPNNYVQSSPGDNHLQEARQTNVLLGQLVSEIQSLKEILSNSMIANQQVMQYIGQHNYNGNSNENEKNLDMLNDYHTKLEQRLKNLNV